MSTLPAFFYPRVRDPWLRVLLVVLLLTLLVVVLALAWHLIGMGDHGMIVGTCMAVVAATGMLLFGVERAAIVRGAISMPISEAAPPRDVAVTGRHPPNEGTVLLD